jgi:hypothetical protein
LGKNGDDSFSTEDEVDGAHLVVVTAGRGEVGNGGAMVAAVSGPGGLEKKEEKGDGGGAREEKEMGWCARVSRAA